MLATCQFLRVNYFVIDWLIDWFCCCCCCCYCDRETAGADRPTRSNDSAKLQLQLQHQQRCGGRRPFNTRRLFPFCAVDRVRHHYYTYQLVVVVVARFYVGVNSDSVRTRTRTSRFSCFSPHVHSEMAGNWWRSICAIRQLTICRLLILCCYVYILSDR